MYTRFTHDQAQLCKRFALSSGTFKRMRSAAPELFPAHIKLPRSLVKLYDPAEFAEFLAKHHPKWIHRLDERLHWAAEIAAEDK